MADAGLSERDGLLVVGAEIWCKLLGAEGEVDWTSVAIGEFDGEGISSASLLADMPVGEASSRPSRPETSMADYVELFDESRCDGQGCQMNA